MSEKLKILHTLVPGHEGGAGLDVTAAELVAGECELGHRAWTIDPLAKPGLADLGSKFLVNEAAADADVMVCHSGMGESMTEAQIPIVHCLHGKPRASWMQERMGGPAIASWQQGLRRDPRVGAVVTFWEDYVPALELITGGEVHYVPRPVDANFWARDRANLDLFRTDPDWGKWNVVVADKWREEADPYNVMLAFCGAMERLDGEPDIKLHVLGYTMGENEASNAIGPLVDAMKKRGWLGYFNRTVPRETLRDFYHSADLMLTCNVVASRTTAEAAACGLPVMDASGEYGHDAVKWILAELDNIARGSQPVWTQDPKYLGHDPKQSAEAMVDVCRIAIQRANLTKNLLSKV